MTFKAAQCPTCAGSLQVPDDKLTVKCMYCGNDVIVREAIRLAAGRVREFTLAEPIESTVLVTPAITAKPLGMTIVAFIIGGLFAVWGFVLLSDSGCCGGIVLVIAMAIAAVGLPRPGRDAVYDKVVSELKGECPYCSTVVSLPAKELGANCPACMNRVVIREQQFHSVDTVVGGVNPTNALTPPTAN